MEFSLNPKNTTNGEVLDVFELLAHLHRQPIAKYDDDGDFVCWEWMGQKFSTIRESIEWYFEYAKTQLPPTTFSGKLKHATKLLLTGKDEAHLQEIQTTLQRKLDNRDASVI